MSKALELFAVAAGGGGIALACVAGVGRLLGVRHLMGLESLTLLVAAIALMAASCVVQLHLLRTR
ncbi:hypothetical protein [Methylomagnum ishizawai]|uniref:hypothetical protein n=1 Tax=Methylomagnum ishizawai TaxID=1760988 RepID=UPI001C33AB28|nr:hypothetical protein [Methylomagnum ishizawai]BBL73466.1 hypothetical protein MishRS11D_05640 [Methylomagnum ishizawai]